MSRAHRFELHLGLPFVDVGEALREQRLQESVRTERAQPRLRRPEFGRAEALGAGRGDDQRPARLQDVERVTMPFTVW